MSFRSGDEKKKMKILILQIDSGTSYLRCKYILDTLAVGARLTGKKKKKKKFKRAYLRIFFFFASTLFSYAKDKPKRKNNILKKKKKKKLLHGVAISCTLHDNIGI